MSWYVIATKPCQEARAVENLNRQPAVVAETYWPRFLTMGKIKSLFPSYLFIRTPTQTPQFTTIRSTFGVRDMIRIGADPATVSEAEIAELRGREGPKGLISFCDFNPGERVIWGVLAGTFEKMVDDERCAVLFQILGRQSRKVLKVTEIRANA